MLSLFSFSNFYLCTVFTYMLLTVVPLRLLHPCFAYAICTKSKRPPLQCKARVPREKGPNFFASVRPLPSNVCFAFVSVSLTFLSLCMPTYRRRRCKNQMECINQSPKKMRRPGSRGNIFNRSNDIRYRGKK
jgi:hypothetical protein